MIILDKIMSGGNVKLLFYIEWFNIRVDDLVDIYGKLDS